MLLPSPVHGGHRGRLRAFAEAGADEVIVIPSPNTERAIRAFGEALALLSQ
jgi:hypothetical protein